MKRIASTILCGLVLGIFLFTGIAQAQWLSPDWANRVAVTINNSSGATLTNYQVLVTLTSSFDFGSAAAGGSDLRVTDSGGVTQIPFWIEEWNSGVPIARIWVKIPSIPSGNTNIYFYYNNPSASVASNGDSTFELFDDDWNQFGSASRNPVHSAGQPWWEATVSYPVVFEDTSFSGRPRYHMLYDGHNVIGHAKGYATSSDLNTWVEYDAGAPHPPNPNPILGTGYTGNAQCAWGDVIKAEGVYYLYYSRGPGQIYRAESTDLITWTDLQPITGGTFGSGAAILKEGDGITPIVVDGKYWMVYFLAFSPGSMYLASTDAAGDLVSWVPWVGNPLLTPTPGGWDQSGLWTPSFARLDDKYYIYYQGQGPTGWDTGFATADAYDGGGTPISPDVATWSKSDTNEDGNPDPVIRRGPGGSWDSGYVIDPMIRKFGDTYYVFYTGNSANGYAYSSSPEGPWTKHGEEGGSKWQVLAGMPSVSSGILTLRAPAAIMSNSTYLYHAIGYKANFVGAGNSWGGFIIRSTNHRTMIGTTGVPSIVSLRNYVDGGIESRQPMGALIGNSHVYEVLWQAGVSNAIVDHGAFAATLTASVPSIALPVTFYDLIDTNPLLVDWVFVRKYFYPEPTSGVGPEESRVITVTIDINPDSETNCFKPDLKGVLPVIIFGSAEVNVYNINISSLNFQGLVVAVKGNKFMAHYEDKNIDGYMDLVVQFQDDSGFVAPVGVSQATLSGTLNNGTPIEGKGVLCIIQ